MLVVDDDADIRGVVVDLLTSEGYRVLEAQNGREALNVLESGRPSVVVLDLMMPVMNGWEFLALRRQRSDLAEIPVLVITAQADASVDADRVLSKPFDLDEFVDIVHGLALRSGGSPRA